MKQIAQTNLAPSTEHSERILIYIGNRKTSDNHLIHYCMYCNTPIQNKITRHFSRKNRDKPDIKL